MSSELIQGFIEQAENCLPTIRGGILICVREGNTYGELSNALSRIISLKDSANILDLREIAAASAELQGKLKFFVDLKQPMTDQQSRELLDKITELETLITKIHFSLEDDAVDFGDFIDESFEQLGLSQPLQNAEIEIEVSSDEAEDVWGEEFEIDDEMLEIFALEAEDLIRSININLEILSEKPDDREALAEIRRNAHTLKGSAGIINLKKLSDVAHRVEDLLAYLADNDIDGSEEVFKLLLASSDCFAALANSEDSVQLNGKIERIYADCDQVREFLAAQTDDFAAGSDAENQIQIVPVAAETSEISVQNVQNRSVVRVSLEKLDDLVKIVGGLVVSRSVFEQRLADFERQIGELHNSTRRLQSSTSKLETDYEAEMLQTPTVSFQSQSRSSAASLMEDSRFDFDTLEFDRYTEFHQTTRELVETTNDTAAINVELDALRVNLESLYDSQRHLIEDMQNKLLRLRMVSFGSLSIRLQRTVRVTGDEEGKSSRLSIEGENLEIDTQILDALIEPLLHLLRNAVAHGIEPPDVRRLLGKSETGNIKLRVVSEGTHIILTISDDGRGISAAALKEKAVADGYITGAQAEMMDEAAAFELIFLTGLTTAEKLSQIAGRGVGMNVVKTNIERRQGSISIESEPRRGTTFTIRLPMALAVTKALLVKAGGCSFAFPLNLVKHIGEISADDLAKSNNSLRLGAAAYTISHLSELLNLPASIYSNDKNVPLLLLETLETPRALIVDEILKSEEIVIKPLGCPLRNLAEFSGATILGDGSVVPVLDLIYLLGSADQTPKSKLRTSTENNRLPENQFAVENQKSKIKIVMIVDDSPSVRHLTSKIVTGAGWTAALAKDGLEALEILQDARQLPDIILSDVEMPRMNGYELLASLKRNDDWRKIPVVMITSRAGDKHRQKAVELGVSEYLTKPFEDAKLIEIISRLS